MADADGSEAFASIEDALSTYQDPDETPEEETLDPDGDSPAADEGDDGGDGLGGAEGAEDPDQDADYAAGRFAADDAMVRLEDGSVTTVADLRRSNLRQADYTKKATQLADYRRALEAETERMQSLDAEQQQQRQMLAYFAKAMLPTPPDQSLIETNPAAYRQQLDGYNWQVDMLGRLGGDIQAFGERQQAEEQRAFGASRADELRRLTERAPEFAREDYYQRFFDEAIRAGEFYGYTPEEFEQINDHRHYLVLRDALAYRTIKARNARSRTKTDGWPPVITGGRRRTSEEGRRQNREAAWARFNRKRSIRNAIDLID